MQRFCKRVGGACVVTIGALGILYAALGFLDSMVNQSGFDSPGVPIGIGIFSLLLIFVGAAIVASVNNK